MSEYRRFWEKVDTSGDCWVWVGGKYPNGYGAFNAGSRADGSRRAWPAHRWLMQELAGRPLAPDEYICHHCDNRLCVRPEHLYLGDASTNAQDREDRNPAPAPGGVGLHKASGRWRAYRRHRHLGLFDTREEAEAALASG